MATYVPYKNLSGTTDAASKFFWTCEAFEQTKSKDFTNFVPITTDNDGFEVLIRDSWRQEVKDQVTIGDIV